MPLNDISACATWECVNSFADWVAAIGTILISAMALWLSMRDRIPRVEATFDAALIPGQNPRILDRWVYILLMTSVRVMPVTISNFKWVYRERILKKGYAITFPYEDKEFGRRCTPLPCELTFGKQAHLLHRDEFFLDLENQFLFDRNKLKSWWKIRTFYIVVQSTIGKEFKAKIHKRARARIWKEYKKWRQNLCQSCVDSP
jgi:hypothetical protein